MNILAKAYGHNFVAVLQPVAIYSSPQLRFELSDTDRVIAEQFSVVYPLILELVRGETFTFIDLSNALNGEAGGSYFDFGHLDARGNGVIAKKLSNISKKAKN